MLHKILVVDDAPLIHEMCRLFLARYQKAQVIGATNGVEALDRLAREENVDLILLDIHMPQMNGFDLLRRLKQEAAYRDIPVVIVSTSGDEASVQRGLAAGARGYLTKPFQADDLHRTIEAVLRSRTRAPRSNGPWALRQPASGHTRIVCSEPCRVCVDAADDLHGVVWNLSVRGVYLILATPFPDLGQPLRLTFPLPDGERALTCRGRIAWRNPPSVFQGLGSIAAGLPPGCGIEFLDLSPDDQARISAIVTAA